MIIFVSQRVAVSHTSRKRPPRIASMILAECETGLNPAATKTFVSKTTDPARFGFCVFAFMITLAYTILGM